MTDGWAVPGFALARELGADASGRQVLATDELTGTKVAIRYLPPALPRDEAFAHRMETLSQLEDDNLVQVYQLVTDGDEAAVVSEYFEGVALRRLLTDPLDAESAVVILSDILLGLAAAHGKGVHHGDVTPDRVLIAPDGRAKLSDLGIAVVQGRGAPAGHPAYQAPERWHGSPQSERADIYAATAVFVECLTGRRLFPATSTSGLGKAHNNMAVPVTDVPGPLRPLVLHGLAKAPGDRPASAADFLAELDDAVSPVFGADWEKRGRARVRELAKRAADAPPPPEPQRSFLAPKKDAHGLPQGGGRKGPLLLAAGGVAAILIVGGVAYAANQGDGDQNVTVVPSEPAASAPLVAVETPLPTPTEEALDGPGLAGKITTAVDGKDSFAYGFKRTSGKESTNASGWAKDGDLKVSLSGQKPFTKRTAVVLDGTAHVQLGAVWQKFPLGKAKTYGVLAAQAHWGGSVATLTDLLDATENLTRKGGTRWLGSITDASGLEDVAPGYKKAKVSYDLTVGTGWLPRQLKLTITAEGKPKVVVFTSYAKWGAKVTIKAPKK
ncbi:serine/threonine-protein kinase [Actinocorallia herbida]|uniref:Serine/threonine-protein kinase n=1 Tax=Actinocorallia herbida TaxID=58109 RepID=A0A3N1D9X2_9ACTN|nr:serine/threonine-protein kinase [Actinocorallia herbida]ROO90321.1 serine/threonine-protein kinase [Actinocorallia herbida]